MADLATGYLRARVAGRLRSEIVRLIMNNDSASDNLAYLKTIRQKRGKCVSMVPEKRRKISRMAGMRAIARVIVPHRTWEWIFSAGFLTRGTLMYVKTKNTSRARARSKRQSSHVRHN